jgi:hypothetical protein
MHSVLSSSLVPAIALTALAVTACGGTPPSPDPTASIASADTGTCSAATTCSGIMGAPPEIIVTCSGLAQFYVISPIGTKTALSMGSTYSGSMSDYAGSIEACTLVSVDWGLEVGSCFTYSTYAPPTSWCPAPPVVGGGSTGGRGGCHGTCS